MMPKTPDSVIRGINKIDTREYVGEWLVICDSEIIAHDKKLKNLEPKILACKTSPLIFKVPQKQVLLY